MMACSTQKTDKQTEQTAPAAGVAVQDTFFPVSAWYSGGKARAPMLSTITEYSEEEWRTDLQKIKDLGFNTVRTWVEWSRVNPQPDVYHFENLKLLARLAKEVGLRFIIQLYVDSAPDWVGQKYPDGLFVAQSGDAVKPQVAPGYCTDHQGVREAVLHFIEKTAQIAAGYPNFHGWDLWSEPHIVNWAYINYVPNVQFCYCDHTKSRFRDWLKSKYTTLEALNEAWYRNFETWEEAEPPRFGTILSYTDFIDWKDFIYAKLAGDLAMRYGAVRRADKTHVITSHAAVPSIFYSPYNGYGATDDFLMAEHVDFYGTSLYPKHNHPSRHWEIWKFMVAVDFSRSANRRNGGFYVGELQAGRGTIGLNIGDPISPGDHRIWMWSAVAKGARGINVYAFYPMSSGYESGGYGLINLDGTLTERAVQAGKTAEIIHENRTLLLSSRPEAARVAIVYNPLAQMVGGEQHHSEGDMHQQSLFGYYRYFAERDIPVDFIHRMDLEKRRADDYRLIILPYPLMLTQESVDGLMDFVRNGGYLLSEARPGWNNEKGFASDRIPGMGLDVLFGARESNIVMRQEIAITPKPQDHPLLNDLRRIDRLSGTYFGESFELLPESEAEVLALHEDGTPAIIHNAHGEGKALLVGSFIGMASHRKPDRVNDRFLSNVVNWAGIEPPLRVEPGRAKNSEIEARLMDNPSGKVLVILNHGTTETGLRVNLRVAGDHAYEVSDIINGDRETKESRNGLLRIERNIAARDVRVFRIEKKR